MSMHVDLSKPLDAKTAAYLAERGRYADLQRVAELTGSDPVPFGAGDGTGPQMRSLGTAEDAAGELDRLRARVAELEAQNAATEDSDVDTAELEPYETWPVPELDAELKARQLPVKGTKPEKVQALYADDESKNAG